MIENHSLLDVFYLKCIESNKVDIYQQELLIF
jgi:hypothetical protein